jgi:hypothetical protein
VTPTEHSRMLFLLDALEGLLRQSKTTDAIFSLATKNYASDSYNTQLDRLKMAAARGNLAEVCIKLREELR